MGLVPSVVLAAFFIVGVLIQNLIFFSLASIRLTIRPKDASLMVSIPVRGGREIIGLQKEKMRQGIFIKAKGRPGSHAPSRGWEFSSPDSEAEDGFCDMIDN